MKSLADEILDALPALLAKEPDGAAVSTVAAHLSVGAPFARAAMKTLGETGRALHFRYPGSRRMRVAPLGFLGPRVVCANCWVAFRREGRSTRICCTRSCSNAWAWARPGATERRSAAIRKAKATPEAREQQRRHNERRWSDPEQHERLSRQNRERWSDPAQKARRSAAIQRVNGSPEARAIHADRRRRYWQDEDNRKKHVAAIREARQRPEVRARQSEEMKRRWADPVLRAKYLAATAENRKLAAEATRGKRQSAELIAKRTAAMKATKKAHPRKQSPEHIRKRLESIAHNKALRERGAEN